MAFKKNALALVVALTYSGFSYANEFKVTSSLTTSYVGNNVSSELEDSRRADNFSLEPSLGLTYKSSRIDARGNIEHQILDRHIQDPTNPDGTAPSSQSYTDYRLRSTFDLVENLLQLNLRAGQNYRDLFSSGQFVNDEFFGSEELTRSNNNSLGFNFTPYASGYFGISANGRVSNVKTDRQSQANVELDNDDESLTVRLFNGNEVKGLRWDITNEYRNTTSTTADDFTSRIFDASVSFGFFRELSFLMVYTKETNERELFQDVQNADLGSERVGAGLAWNAGRGRLLELTYNRSKEGQTNEEEGFVGVNLNWRLTSRTSVAGSYDRRFFGDTASFNLSHNSRLIRSRIRYQERITTFSRLVEDIESLGVFVCPSGGFSFTDCFQPDTVNYELQPGEQFNEFNRTIPEINDTLNIRKSLDVSVGYFGRKLKSNLSIRNSKSEVIDTGQETTIRSASLDTSYKFGVRTSLNFNLFSSDNERIGREGEENIESATLGIDHQLNRALNLDLSFRYSDRDSSDLSRVLKDRRITFKVKYLLF